MTTKEFNALINRIKNLDENAFAEIYNEYSRLVMWIALKIMKNKDDAHDVFNITMAAIWNDASSFGYIEKPNDWISEIARNKAINYYNKHIKRQSQNTDFESISDSDTYNYLLTEPNSSEAEFNSLICSLSEKEQTIVKLKIYYKYTHQEIAEKLNMPVGTVCWKFNEALRKLRIKLSQKNSDFTQ